MFACPCFPLLQAKNAWVTFIKNCEVLNVNEVSSLNPLVQQQQQCQKEQPHHPQSASPSIRQLFDSNSCQEFWQLPATAVQCCSVS